MFHKTVDITQLKDLHRLNGNATIDYLFLPFFLITYMCVWSAWSLLLNIANKYLLTSYINVQELIVDWEVIADWTIVHKPFHPVAKDIYGSPHYPLSLRCFVFFFSLCTAESFRTSVFLWEICCDCEQEQCWSLEEMISLHHFFQSSHSNAYCTTCHYHQVPNISGILLWIKSHFLVICPLKCGLFKHHWVIVLQTEEGFWWWWLHQASLSLYLLEHWVYEWWMHLYENNLLRVNDSMHN